MTPVQAAFFDLDKTVIAKSSVLAFGRPLYREGLLPRSALIRSVYGQALYRLGGASEAKMDRARDSMLSLIRGWEQSKVTGVVRDTYENVVTPIIFAEALTLFDEHHAAGRQVFLVSAAPTEIVAELAEHLGVDDHIATRSVIDEAGRYTGELEFYAYGPHKAAAIRRVADARGIDLDGSYAYSDSITDLPMLEVVGHPVAVNPDRDLARVARQRGWDILRFEHPVRLRRRPPAAPTAAVGGAMVAVSLGLAGWRWLRHRPAQV